MAMLLHVTMQVRQVERMIVTMTATNVSKSTENEVLGNLILAGYHGETNNFAVGLFSNQL